MKRLAALATLLIALALAGCDDTATGSCHPSYEGACLDPDAYDYDCEGGEGDGPEYTGYVEVVGPDDYDLDRDGNGEGCQ